MNDDRLDEIIRGAARDYNAPAPVPRDEMWEAVAKRRQAARAAAAPRSPRREWIWRGIGIAAVLVIGIAIGRAVERSGSGRSGTETSTVASAAGRGTSPVARSSTDSSVGGSLPGARPESIATPAGGVSTLANRNADSPDASTSTSTSPDRGGVRDAGQAAGLAFRLAVLQHLGQTEAMLVSFRATSRSGDVDAQLTAWSRNLLQTTRLLQASAAASGDATLRRLLDDLELVLLQIAQYTSTSPRRAEELELIDQAIEKRGVMTKLRTTSAPPIRWGAGT